MKKTAVIKSIIDGLSIEKGGFADTLLRMNVRDAFEIRVKLTRIRAQIPLGALCHWASHNTNSIDEDKEYYGAIDWIRHRLRKIFAPEVLPVTERLQTVDELRDGKLDDQWETFASSISSRRVVLTKPVAGMTLRILDEYDEQSLFGDKYQDDYQSALTWVRGQVDRRYSFRELS